MSAGGILPDLHAFRRLYSLHGFIVMAGAFRRFASGRWTRRHAGRVAPGGATPGSFRLIDRHGSMTPSNARSPGQPSMDGASDEDLMLRIATGDEPAFRVLARRYAPLALRLARRVMGSSADAEEIVQEALLRLWVNAPRWRPVASFRTWFYRVVINLCLNRKRRAPFLPLEDVSDPADPTPDAAAGMERREIDRALATAIAELPERQRAAIALTYHEGLSNAETAAALGTSVSAVETLLVRAKRTLRQRLSPMLEVGSKQT
jgi:RNA polymerase sigma-70 factor, ECF subfamily